MAVLKDRVAFHTSWHSSVREIAQSEWDALAAGSPEDWSYYRALEEAPPDDMRLGAASVRDAAGRLIMAVPTFEMHYRLDTPLQTRVRSVVDRVSRIYPRFARLKVVGLGSPLSDSLGLVASRRLSGDEREEAFAHLLDCLLAAGKARRASLVAIKSITVDDDRMFRRPLDARKLNVVTSVPVVTLPIQGRTLDDFYGSLPRKTAAYLKRKHRSANSLAIEYRSSLAGLEQRVIALYQATLAQSAVDYGDFDQLSPQLLASLLDRLGERAKLMLCWHGETLVSFQVFLVGSQRIIAYKIGMKYPEAREHNLYFVNWIEMIKFALERGILEIEMGATTYSSKLLFGGNLERRLLRFRFCQPIANALLRPLASVFDFEDNDEELQRLIGEGRIERFRP